MPPTEASGTRLPFYDKKCLIRLLIQNTLKDRYRTMPLSSPYSFEDELLFVHGISAAEYDAVLHAWYAKREHDLVRPTTVIQ